MRKLWLLVLFLLIIPVSVFADDNESIISFQSDLFLLPDGSVEVTETIEYDFDEPYNRGIIRTIPIIYDTSVELAMQTDFSLLSVSRLGEPNENHKVTTYRDYVEVRIGDPEKYIRGVHTYTIKYLLYPAVVQADGEDIFRFDINGFDWDVPIEEMEVTFDTDNQVLSSTCYGGEQGENLEGLCKETDDGYTTTRTLEPGENITVEYAFAPGSFPAYLQEIPKSELEKPFIFWATVIPLTLFSLFNGLIIGSLKDYIAYRLRRKDETVVPHYEPPQGLSPAEVGFLVDSNSSRKEFSATVIDLARRGYLKFENLREDGKFRKKSMRLVKTKEDTSNLLSYEKKTLEAVLGYSMNFSSESLKSILSTAKSLSRGKVGYKDLEGALAGQASSSNTSVTLSSIDASKVQAAMTGMKNKVLKRLEAKNYYRRYGLKAVSSPSASTSLTLLAIVAGFIAAFYFLNVVYAATSGLLIGWLVATRMITPAFERLTSKGYKVWSQVEGFKEFLSVAEKDRLEFHNAPERTPEQFNDLLPYAIALGVEKKWAKQFEGMDLSKATSWYGGNYGALAATDLVSNISKASSVYAPSSSSASGGSTGSGGSFSGGGIGGGGGGSW